MFGSHLIGFTRTGAARLLKLMESSKATHIDLWFRDVLLRDGVQEQIEACLIHPAVGSYGAQHVSMNLKGARRQSAWREGWCQEGTRESASGLGPNGRPYAVRSIHAWSKTSEPPLLRTVPLENEVHRYMWKTALPPRTVANTDVRWHAMLVGRGWVWEDGSWRGPFGDMHEFSAFHGVHDAEKAGERPHDLWWKLKETNRWRALQERPTEVLMDLGQRRAPLTRLAAELVTEPFAFEDRGRKCRREARHHRQKLNLYRRRYFVRGDDEEVLRSPTFASGFFFPGEKWHPQKRDPAFVRSMCAPSGEKNKPTHA